MKDKVRFKRNKPHLWIFILCFVLMFSCMPIGKAEAKESGKKTVTAVQKAESQNITISKKERKQYFAESAFIGSSIGVGQKNYFQYKGKYDVGRPVMMVQKCYSFMNDKSLHPQYSLVYRGKHMRAKDALKLSGVKRVFICMGTNDLWKAAASTYADYVSYIREIQKRNPKLIIFIESTPPMCSAQNRRNLNNKSINTLNKLMKKYCESRKNMYYIDISKGMREGSGGLRRKYSSDGYVHLNNSGYEVWTKNLVNAVEKLLKKEKQAEAAVQQAGKTKKAKDYKKAQNLVSRLEKSTKKDTLKKKLKKYASSIKSG